MGFAHPTFMTKISTINNFVHKNRAGQYQRKEIEELNGQFFDKASIRRPASHTNAENNIHRKRNALCWFRIRRPDLYYSWNKRDRCQ